MPLLCMKNVNHILFYNDNYVFDLTTLPAIRFLWEIVASTSISLSLSGCSCRWGNVWICNLSLCLSERQIFLAKSVSKSLHQTFLQNQHWKPAFETETGSFMHINAPLDTQHKLPQKHSSYVRGLVLSKDIIPDFKANKQLDNRRFIQWSLIQRGKDHSNCPGQRCRGRQESH